MSISYLSGELLIFFIVNSLLSMVTIATHGYYHIGAGTMWVTYCVVYDYMC